MINNNGKTIAFFDDSYFPIIDGVAYVVDTYARILTKMGYNVIVVVPKIEGADDSVFPYKVLRCWSKKLSSVGYRLAFSQFDRVFRKQLGCEKIDLIHIHSPFTLGKLGIKYAKKHKIPVIGTLHTQFKQDFYRFTKSKLLTFLALKIIMSNFNKCFEMWSMNENCHRILREYGYKGKYRQMINATEMLPLNEEERERLKIQVKEQYGITKENVFVFVGRLVEQKNIFFIADCLKKMKDSGLDFQMVFVGSGLDGDALKEKVKNLGLENDCIFTGMVRDRKTISAIYALGTLQLFPSMYDSNALVQIEAASEKLPTVLIRGSVTSAFITDKQNGFLLEEDVDKFASGVIEILKDKQTLLEVKERALKEIYVNWNTVVKSVDLAYQEIIKEYYCDPKNCRKTTKKEKQEKTNGDIIIEKTNF